MSYFSENYGQVRYPLESQNTGAEQEKSLRNAQAGAIHAIAGHFTVSNDPALVVMPTGSGKTAVLLTSPFILRATRALVITPSQLVRGQIADGAKNLAVLKAVGVLPDAVAVPKVLEVKEKMATAEAWEALRGYDFVIATPNCTSPDMEGVVQPPVDLFDVLLIDEAHHAAAKTWAALLNHFATARRILFTATPYRRDKKLINAKSVYTYPLRRAFEDKIFGKVNFIAVDGRNGGSPDAAIAIRAEQVFRKDRESGLAHVIMVRTDSKVRAEALQEVYKTHTKLKLQLIHSGHSAPFVKKAIERLRMGVDSLGKDQPPEALDGIICVNMMGEGFDFPYLKIAAIHTPHQSLAVTLQFIGRFARTTCPNIGEAQFIAVPDEIAGEAEELFHERAIWNEIVPNLSEARVKHEQHVREVIASFERVRAHRDDNAEIEFDLGSIKPFCHVKIYAVDKFVGFKDPPSMPGNFELVQYDVSEEHHCAITLLKEQIRPRWTDYDDLSKVEYDFILTYYDEFSKHLFICSSRRASLALYDAVGEHYAEGSHRVLALYEINRVLHDLAQPVVFQVGMKNSVTSSNSESYQTKMGSDLKQAISDTDGKLNHRGHVYLRGEEAGKSVTIGYSSGSKVWSNSTLRVPEVILWCKGIGAKLVRTGKVVTGTTLDFLGVGEAVDSLPEDVIAVGWNDDVHKHSNEVSGGGESFQLHDVAIEIIGRIGGKLSFRLSHGSFTCDLQMEVVKSRVVLNPQSDLKDVSLIRKNEMCPLLTYLKENPFHVYLSDFSRISGGTLFRSSIGENAVFSTDYVVTTDWVAEGIDITKEFLPPGTNGADNSIHGYLARTLPASRATVIIYDHGTGEIGDFIAVEETASEILFSIYHCKGAGGDRVGQRVGDVYEVAGQVVKSLIWLKKPDDLHAKIRARLDQGSTFLKGDKALLREMFVKSQTKSLQFIIYCVQPGLSSASLAEKLTAPMAAARDYVARSCRGKAMFWISV